MNAVKKIMALTALAGALVLTGCGVSEDTRYEVQGAIVVELIPETILESSLDGDPAAVEFADNMHALAEEMTVAIVDEGMCDSTAYEAGLEGSPELLDAHEAGCAVFESN